MDVLCGTPKEIRRFLWFLSCGKFQYLARFVGRSALVGTLESCSVLGYICLYLTFEFKVMGLELAGWFARTFCHDFYWTHIYLAERPFLLILILLVLLVPHGRVLASACAKRLFVCA